MPLCPSHHVVYYPSHFIKIFAGSFYVFFYPNFLVPLLSHLYPLSSSLFYSMCTFEDIFHSFSSPPSPSPISASSSPSLSLFFFCLLFFVLLLFFYFFSDYFFLLLLSFILSTSFSPSFFSSSLWKHYLILQWSNEVMALMTYGSQCCSNALYVTIGMTVTVTSQKRKEGSVMLSPFVL